MSDDVNEKIELLKRRFRVITDEGLAKRLHLGRSTVTSWRRRGSIPERYIQMAEGQATFLPDFLDKALTDVDRAAMTLALVRLIKGFGAEITDYRSYLSKGGFLNAQMAIGVEKAFLDITALMVEEDMTDAHQCLNLIVYNEFFSS
ncbi:MAG: hypothetical protein LBE86_13100 [Gemmobacter sp.]|jgi:hypothetical protein|nr:hypothetical protein [Gemmobacter sp.]